MAPMTASERMVWAAVFARKLDYSHGPLEWKRRQVAIAAGSAGSAVRMLREAQGEISKRLDEETAAFAAQMVNVNG